MAQRAIREFHSKRMLANVSTRLTCQNLIAKIAATAMIMIHIISDLRPLFAPILLLMIALLFIYSYGFEEICAPDR